MTYTKITTASEEKVNDYLNKGWKLLDTTKSAYDPSGNDTRITYHLGYPVENRIEDLLAIIKLYEANGLKEQLFSKLTTESGIDLNDYSNSGFGWKEDHPTLELLTRYEKIVNDKDVVYYSKKDGIVF